MVNNSVLDRLLTLIDNIESKGERRLPPERSLARELQISRGTLRKVLAALEKEGRIWRHVGQGTFVGKPPALVSGEITKVSAEVNPGDIMEARLILEPKLAALTALRATINELQQMDSFLDKSRDAIDTAGFEYWDEMLHQEIANATDNPLLISFFILINKVRQSNVWGGLKEISLTPERKKLYYAQHLELLEALKDRDALKAEKLMKIHLETVRDHLLGVQQKV
ncbi:MAG: FadR/GntR family transcriptional regulator [Thermodesulfobacteriota bacterium]